MTTLPIEIVNKIIQYVAEINAEEKTFINYEILTYKLKKSWSNIHEELLSDEPLLHDSIGRYTNQLDLPTFYQFVDILPALIDENNMIEFYSGGNYPAD